MNKKKCEYDKVVDMLAELKKLYPNYTMGQHIATAFSDYPDIWGVTDKEFLFALNKYQTELQLDAAHTVDESYISKVVEQGMHLETLFDEEDEDGD